MPVIYVPCDETTPMCAWYTIQLPSDETTPPYACHPSTLWWSHTNLCLLFIYPVMRPHQLIHTIQVLFDEDTPTYTCYPSTLSWGHTNLYMLSKYPVMRPHQLIHAIQVPCDETTTLYACYSYTLWRGHTNLCLLCICPMMIANRTWTIWPIVDLLITLFSDVYLWPYYIVIHMKLQHLVPACHEVIAHREWQRIHMSLYMTICIISFL